MKMHFKYVLIIFMFAGGLLTADAIAETLYFLNFNHGAQSPGPDPYTVGTGEILPSGMTGSRFSTDSNLINTTPGIGGIGEGGQSLSQISGSMQPYRQGYVFDLADPVPDMNVAYNEYTIEVLIKPDLSGCAYGKSEHATIFSTNDGVYGRGCTLLEMDQNDVDAGRIHFYPHMWDKTMGALHSSERLKSDQWYHVAVVLRSNLSGGPQRTELWINGKLDTVGGDCGGCTSGCDDCTGVYPPGWELQGIYTLKGHFSVGGPMNNLSTEEGVVKDYNSQNWQGEIDAVAISDEPLYPSPFVLTVPPCYSQSLDGDYNYDCYVNAIDYADFAAEWRECTNAGQIGCSTWPDPNHVIPLGSAVIDGNIAEWAGATWIPINNTLLYARPDDLPEYLGKHNISTGPVFDISSAAMALRWEPNVVYAAVVVYDTAFHFADIFTNPTCGDMLELFSQGNDLGGFFYGYYAQEEGDISGQCSFAQHYVMGPNTLGGSWAGFHMRNPDTGDWEYKAGAPEFDKTGFNYAIKTNSVNHTIIYEAAVKQFDRYGGINGEPNQVSTLYPGKVIGFDVSVGSRRKPVADGDTYFKTLVEAQDANPWHYTDELDADLFRNWRLGSTDCGLGYHLPTDISGPGGVPDCVVDMYDLRKFALDWMMIADLS